MESLPLEPLLSQLVWPVSARRLAPPPPLSPLVLLSDIVFSDSFGTGGLSASCGQSKEHILVQILSTAVCLWSRLRFLELGASGALNGTHPATL